MKTQERRGYLSYGEADLESKEIQITFGECEGSKLHGETCLFQPWKRDWWQDITGQLREDWSLEITDDVVLSPVYKAEPIIHTFPKMPAEKSRKLSIVFLFTLI